ncbi:MAG: ferritin [Elusimicrobia bacterium]|nr:ferritin [Elusimicrobiota bacterium]
MISKKMQDAINFQINAEIYSSYLYLSMSAFAVNANLKGFAHWLKVQSGEETKHAMKLYDYLLDRGGKVELAPLKQPPVHFQNMLDIFEQTYEHEKKVTGLINKLYETALKENDYPAQVLLQWFINEQVEEEASAREILEKLQLLGEKATGSLLYLDKELKKREG